jgi:hypothetical protein
LWCEQSMKWIREQTPFATQVAMQIFCSENGPRQPVDVAAVALSDGLSLHRSSPDSNRTEPNRLAQTLGVFLTRAFSSCSLV